jgi:hypothetical protein
MRRPDPPVCRFLGASFRCPLDAASWLGGEVVFSVSAGQTGRVKGTRWLGLGIVWGGAVLARTLAAATPIEWEAPEGCPGVQVVHEELQRALGHELGELGGLSRVRGAIVAEAAGYRLTLEVSDAGRRSLRFIHAERCQDLANAAALAIALAIHARPGASDGVLGAEATGVIGPMLQSTSSSVPSARDTIQGSPRMGSPPPSPAAPRHSESPSPWGCASCTTHHSAKAASRPNLSSEALPGSEPAKRGSLSVSEYSKPSTTGASKG